MGSVQSADRAIRTALGNTTNRAARFQGSHASSARRSWWTRPRTPQPGRRFERRERIEIRGRREPEDLYVLPLR